MEKLGVTLFNETENVKRNSVELLLNSNDIGIKSNQILNENQVSTDFRQNEFNKVMETTSSNKSTDYLSNSDINLTESYNNVFTNSNFHKNVSVEPSEDNELDWSGLLLVALFCVLIVITIIGNTLIILSVITTKRLRTVTNCFVMSLAVADWLVGIFVMPPAVAYFLMGSWHLGWVLCDIWISLDVLLCTASILSLCAISIDRYLAVTQPLNYSKRRRSKRLALLMILIVWILALAITCPPILGWYEPGRRELLQCRYNENRGYVVFSAMGSFFIPMIVMLYVYARISCVIASRHDQMSEIKVHQKSTRIRHDEDCDYDSESDHKTQQIRKRFSDQMSQPNLTVNKTNMTPYNNSSQNIRDMYYKEPSEPQNGHYELVDINNPLTPNLKRNPTITYKLSNIKPQWSSDSIQMNENVCRTTSSNISLQQHHNNQQALHQQHSHPHHNNQFNRSVRTQQKTLSTRISSLKRESKTAQTLSIVVGGFILCWLPFFIYYIIIPFLPSELKNASLQMILTWLGWINSAINPFIYAFYSVDFRAAFWRLTLRRFFKNSRLSSSYPSNAFSTKR